MTFIKEHFLLIFLLSALTILLFPAPILASHRYLVFSFVPFLSFLYLSFYDSNRIIYVNKSVIGFCTFSFVGLLSYFWAINKTLIWFPAFSWIGIFLWMILVRSVLKDRASYYTYIGKYLYFLYGILLLSTAIVVFFTDVSITQATLWNKYLGYNGNYIPNLLLLFFPFILFHPAKTIVSYSIRLLLGGFITYLILITSNKGALISFLVLLLALILPRINKKLLTYIFYLIGIILFSCYFFKEELWNVLSYSEFKSINGRYNLFIYSLRMFLDNPLAGVGLGNWYIEAYLNTSNIFDAKELRFSRIQNHNLFTTILSEVGLIGFIAFCYAFFLPILRTFKGWTLITYKEKAILGVLIVYIINSLVFLDANNYEAHFSGIQLIAFCCLGSLSILEKDRIEIRKLGKLLICLLSLCSSVWFSYYYYTETLFKEVERNEINNNQKSIELINEIYHPIFKTTHGIRISGGVNEPLQYKRALLLENKKDYEGAELAFKEALDVAPNDEVILMSFAQFKLRKQLDYKGAKKFLAKVNKIQPEFLEAKVYLAEIAIVNKEFSIARKYLDSKHFNNWHGYKFHLKYYEELLYRSTYLKELCGLSAAQLKNLQSIFIKQDSKLDSISVDILQLEHYLENKSKYEKELKKLKKQIDSNLKVLKLDEIVQTILTKSQFFTYYRDRIQPIYSYNYLDTYTNLLKLDLIQKDKFLKIHVKNTIEQKYYALKIRNKVALQEKDSIRYYRVQKDSVFKIKETGLYEILTERQFRIFMDYRTESKYRYILKNLNKKYNLKDVDRKANQLKSLIQKYEYEKTLALIRGKEDKIPNILGSLKNSLKLILDDKEYQEFKKISKVKI